MVREEGKGREQKGERREGTREKRGKSICESVSWVLMGKIEQ